MEAREPLSVSLHGCGLWKTALTPFNAMRILDPRPSDNSAPKAASSDSMSDHSTPDCIGRVKIDLSVFLCFAFTI